MEKVLIVNASPRAPRSNSKVYARMFADACPIPTKTFAVTKKNHPELCEIVGGFSHLLFVFPLYADGIPVTLLNVLKAMEEHPSQNKPEISVLIDCGFLEARQNDVAVEMVRIFCRKNGYAFGSVLKIGSGEAILTTPFKGMVARKIKKLAQAVASGQSTILQTSMPLPKGIFLRASTKYWEGLGAKNGVSPEQMNTMKIE